MTDRSPLVSIVLTAFNREEYLAESVESVLDQTYGNFELLIVDDASTDRTLEVARGFESDPRVRVVANEMNLGDYPNRNYGASLAKGEFLKFHDSDDVMYPFCIERLLLPLLEEPRAAFALTASKAWPGAPVPLLSTPAMSFERELLGTGMFYCGPACGLFRRDFFQSFGGFPTDGPGSDFSFWVKACSKANVLLVGADLFWYRLHAGQELQSAEAESSGIRADAVMWRVLNSGECPLAGPQLFQARRNWIGRYTRALIRDISRGRLASASYRARHSGISASDWLKYLGPVRRREGAGAAAKAG